MTLDEAITILSKNKHNGASVWYLYNDMVENDTNYDEELTQFEAIAIAEKYLRDSQGIVCTHNYHCIYCGKENILDVVERNDE